MTTTHEFPSLAGHGRVLRLAHLLLNQTTTLVEEHLWFVDLAKLLPPHSIFLTTLNTFWLFVFLEFFDKILELFLRLLHAVPHGLALAPGLLHQAHLTQRHLVNITAVFDGSRHSKKGLSEPGLENKN